MRNYFFTIIIIIWLCNACNSKQKGNTDFIKLSNAKSEKNNSLIKLFNGSDLKGWHTYGDSIAGIAWKVEDSAIHLDASRKNADETVNGGDLVTDSSFKNFDLKFQWKISKGGNSGVRIYIEEDTSKYEDNETGMEMQIVDNINNDDGKIANHRCGSLYDVIAANADAARPAGEWNDAEIISSNKILQFYLNNKKVVETILWNDNWRKLIAKSKFKNMKDWGSFKEGKISLQDHGFDVWYKNIFIKKL